jgi:diamine N-acetyltransferase
MAENDPLLLLRGERIGFGPLRHDLLETYTRWVNDLQITRTLALPCLPHTVEKQEKWIQGALGRDDDVLFTVYILETMRPIGNVGLHDIDHDSGSADFGMLIGEKDIWGQGYGTEATRLAVSYGFDVLGLHNIQLETYGNNPGAIKAYERAGFKHIGVRRGAKRIGRQRVDIYMMDILAEEVEPSDLHRLMQTGAY